MTQPPVQVLPAVVERLEEAGRRGFLGPRSAADHAAHAVGFAAAWHAVAAERPPTAACDLGSGGGVPGLVLSTGCWPETAWVLLDAMGKRCAFLEESIAILGLADRVRVACGRAEQLGREGQPLRGAFDLVTSRGFGRPSATAEVAAPLLQPGGLLIVSEPPDSDGSRWAPAGCAAIGLVPLHVVRSSGGGFMVLRQDEPASMGFPRSPKAQARRPLF